MISHVTRFQLIAGSRKDLSRNIVMFNKLDTQPTLVVRIPTYVAQNYTMSSVICCEDNEDISEHASITDNYPWIDVLSENLNLDAGTHTYRVTFDNHYSNETMYMYFGYIIQDDDPDKPYIYMEEHEA